jgi:RimJ/RimL family protein N-acetyltransferase
MLDVTIREPIETDLPILFEHQRDPVSVEMAAFPGREWDAYTKHQREIYEDPTTTFRTVVLDGVVVGAIQSWEVDGRREVGYWIGREYWGRGIATAALAAFLEVDRTRPLTARVATHNGGSLRVLQKSGFRVLREQRADDGVDEYFLELVGIEPPPGSLAGEPDEGRPR